MSSSPPEPINPPHRVESITQVLTPAEVALLAAWIWDGQRQIDIAEQLRVAQSTVSWRAALAVGKLRRAGMNVTTPKRGKRTHVAVIDPDKLMGLEANQRMRASRRNRKSRRQGG